MLLKDFVNKKMASAEKVASAEGVPLTLNNCKKYKKMRDLKVYGNCFQSTLTYPYQSVQYIESTGTQYIDTGFYGTSTRIQTEVKFSLSKIQAYGPHIISNDGFFIVARNNNNGEFFYVCGDSNIFPYSWELNKEYAIKTNANEAMINDDTFVIDNISEVEQTQGTLLMAYRGNPQSTSYTFSGKLYYAKLYYDNVLVRDFVPCYNVETNVIGMYDTVNSAFYPNKGGGVFIKGPNTVPTPENPIEVQCVGEKSRNLFDPTQAIDDSYVMKVSHNSDGSFNLKGTLGSQNFCYYHSLAREHFIASGTVVAISSTYETTDSRVALGIMFYDADGKGVIQNNGLRNGTKATLTMPRDVYKLGFVWIVSGGVSGEYVEINNIKIQVELGSTATDFIPYNKYRVPIICRGKNYFSLKNANATTQTINGITFTPLGDERIHIKGHLADATKGVRYALNGLYIPLKAGVYRAIPYVYMYTWKLHVNYGTYYTGGAMNIQPQNGAQTVPTDGYINYLHISVSEGNTTEFDDIIELQVEKSNVSSAYEPHVEPITTNLYLDEPLRKLGTYADCIDGKNDKVVRNMGLVVFTDNLSMAEWRSTEEVLQVTTSMCDKFKQSSKVMCNYFMNGSAATKEKNTVVVSTGISRTYFRFDKSQIATIDDAVSWFKSKYDAGNPVVVIGQLATPIEEPLNIELPKLNAKTTIIEVDTSLVPSNIIGKYIIR